MRPNLLTIATLSVALSLAAAGAARADCESDLIQLEQAYKAPDLTAAGKAALDDAKVKAFGGVQER